MQENAAIQLLNKTKVNKKESSLFLLSRYLIR